MKKVLIKIKNDELIIKLRSKISSDHKNLMNTNVISYNELVFSEDYLKENCKIVSTFLNDLCKTNNLQKAIIEDSSIALQIIELLQNNKCITELVLKDETPLTYSLCEAIIKTSITSINCYNLQAFMLEYLDTHGIIVESRNEILFLSNFMLENNLSIFSSLFYKIILTMDFPMSEQDEEDFITFCKINKYLKKIHVNRASLNNLEFITDVLKKTGKKNINIQIHDNITDPNTIEFLRNYNKKKSKQTKIYFQLVYSEDYIHNNLVKQTNSKILKTCGIIIMLIICSTFTYVFYDNYASMQNVNDIKDDISHVIEITDPTEIIENIIAKEEEEEKPDESDSTTPDETEKNPPNTKPKLEIKNTDIATLTSINPETVAWIKVNNTKIDYPIVQGSNNEFYLKHNFYLESDNNGWVFMDYRNNPKELNDNTIIYAHNRYYSGVMFGTLQNTLRSSWYTKEENHNISFRTLYKTYNFKVFSVYKIYKTTDYMSTTFTDNTIKQEFFQMLKDRSIYDFGITPNGEDKIITLSTCVNGDYRIVLHAVLTP